MSWKPVVPVVAVAFLGLASLAMLPAGIEAAEAKAKKRIVFLTGEQSHGWAGHAYTADCKLLARLLNENVPGVEALVVQGGWPEDRSLVQGAAAIVIACDGNGVLGPMANYKALDALAKKGMGIAFIHYALDVGDDDQGRYLVNWIGGYYQQHWSVNPSWKARFKSLPEHPITRGVKPFELQDEWYFHMRLRDGMEGVTPILSAVPPDSTRRGADGPHSGNPTVRSRMGMPEHVAWACERADGGRGFGFTGGHVHWNYGHNELRTLLLNAFCWIAKVEVPATGVRTKTPSAEEMEANLVGERPEQWTREVTQKVIEELNQ